MIGRPRTEWPMTTRRDGATDAAAATGATDAAWDRVPVGNPRSSRAKMPFSVAFP